MDQPQEPQSAKQHSPKSRLILFVAGDERNSRLAKENLARICRDMLAGRCEVQYVDVVEDFDTAQKFNILLTPTLLVVEPRPQVMIVGNLSDMEEVCAALRVGYRKELA